MPKISLRIKELIAIKPSDCKGVYLLYNSGECELEDVLKDLLENSKSSFVPYRLRKCAEIYNSGDRLSKAKFKILQGYTNIAEFIISNHRFLGFFLNEKFILVLHYVKKSKHTPKRHIDTVDNIRKEFIASRT